MPLDADLLYANACIKRVMNSMVSILLSAWEADGNWNDGKWSNSPRPRTFTIRSRPRVEDCFVSHVSGLWPSIALWEACSGDFSRWTMWNSSVRLTALVLSSRTNMAYLCGDFVVCCGSKACWSSCFRRGIWLREIKLIFDNAQLVKIRLDNQIFNLAEVYF